MHGSIRTGKSRWPIGAGCESLWLQAQRPKWGRSPFRMAIRLLAINRRSMVAIRRPNRVLEGKRSIDAVLDISVPFFWLAELFRRAI